MNTLITYRVHMLFILYKSIRAGMVTRRSGHEQVVPAPWSGAARFQNEIDKGQL